MKIFNARHFLRHLSMPTLQEFTEGHILGTRLAVDWTQLPELLPAAVADLVDDIETLLQDPAIDPAERKAIEQDLWLWHDDLRRAHMMANGLSIQEFRSACGEDPEIEPAFASRDEKEIALWMLTYRDKAFRDAELHIAFQAKTNGKYWKKHRIQPGLKPTHERALLDAFCHDVAQLYKKDGAGEGIHIEISERPVDESVQLTIYVEGPVTALAHFAQNNFTRLTTRIALESAITYHPATGMVETIVKGGAKNHTAVLQLFGKHVVGQEITPEEIEKKRYRLNALRDGLMEPFEDWSTHGVEMVRLRRAHFSPAGNTAIGFQVEASPDQGHDDAIRIALDSLNVEHSFEAEYNMDGASVIVYTGKSAKGKTQHFSFNLYASGSSTIKNLSARNQVIANAVLRALNVIDSDEAPVEAEEPADDEVFA
jgi:hypothetical protein